MAARGTGDAAAAEHASRPQHRASSNQSLASMRPLCYHFARGRRLTTDSIAIGTVAVVGAGQMGAGIAQVIARAGLPVTLSDRAPELAEQAKAKLEARLRKQ